jgi:hypothetical protein
MKTFRTTAAFVVALSAPALVVALSAPALAGEDSGSGSNIHGDDSRGEPFNSTYRATGVDPSTGYTIGHTGLAPGRRYGGRVYVRVPGYAMARANRRLYGPRY